MDHPGHLRNRHRGKDCSCLIKSTFEAICCRTVPIPLNTTSSLGREQTAVDEIPSGAHGSDL